MIRSSAMAVLLCLVALFSMTTFPAAARVAELPFETATVSEQAVAEVYVADAVIEAVNRATIAAETSGRIKEIYFDVDDEVTQGDVLLRFSDKEQRARLAQAEAKQREAEARLREAEVEYERVKKVFARKLVSQAALDKASANLKATRQRVSAARASVKQAREQLNYTVVRAPYAGIVVERHVEVGEMARPGTLLMTGFSLQQLRASASVPQSVMSAVRKIRKASISLRDPLQPGERIAEVVAQKVTIYPYADEKTHDFKVRLQLPQNHASYYPGMFVKAVFEIGSTQKLLVPAQAVVHRSEVTAVYVMDENDRVSFRQVRVGGRLIEGDQLEALAGLTAGERVALDPVHAGVMLKEQRTGGAQGGSAQ
ncbi:MAG: efflux RND transporter periplasmic adaptor subunit [Gammaproteobacteria bacterium]|nr:efflux RND transporter periplasmic adaptor subunit [Gammaproteobacteria bacterium]MCF6363635.1 efflux RND transporter periplasmic adaptor subunit [Gammaproteobacteria bacterium]